MWRSRPTPATLSSSGTPTRQYPDLGSIRGQRYAADGTPQGTELDVFTHNTKDTAWAYSIAMDADGDFAVAWSSGAAGGYVVLTFAADGTPTTDPFLFAQLAPTYRVAMAMQPDGDFVLAWSHGPSNETADVVARRFQANGTPKEAEFPVNTTLAGDQLVPSVAVDAGGDFTVVWSGQGPGDADGVFAQRYAAPSSPLDGSATLTADAALLAWVDFDSSDDDESDTDILTTTLADDMALMLVE